MTLSEQYNKFVSKFLFTILISLFLFVTPLKAQAAEIIKDFNTKIVAHRNGDMTITETIQYDFDDLERHGIYRFIPTYTKVGNLYRISDISFKEIKRDGKNEPNEKSYHADEVEVKIGDPDRTINGLHSYEIVYEVKNGIGSNYDDHDEIYWNATGNKWNIPIEKASAEITTDFNAIPTDTICFSGSFGSKEQLCRSVISGNLSQTETKGILSPQEGLTVVTAFPVGTFPKSQLNTEPPLIGKSLKTILIGYAVLWIFLNTFVFGYVLRRYLKGRSKIRFGKPAVNFDIPKDDKGKIISPMEAGIIDNTKLEQDDVMATIFDLAIRKVIKIEELEKKKTLGMFGGGSEYILKKLKDSTTGISEFEQILLDKLFSGGDEVNLKDISSFYTTFSRLEDASFKSLVERRFYTKNPKNQKAGLLVLGIFGIVTLNILLGGLLVYLSTKLNGRTELGDKFDRQIEGLKIFLKNMKRHYNFQVKNAITVEKYIPYAMAFGFIDEFMEEFKDMYPNYHPSWYSGNTNFYMAQNAMVSSMHSNFTTSAPSSSSGFSGGGSSGGGGDGGGGGSW